ncbi:MAG: tRNA (adenosine(37)-N6)-threonylcarbamoyltransferase complex dimerization subunit type 1 TsaB [Candidatus Saganbacteria bacterium]|nr:tRNA (adenosine(37)-N6)-threonylcarbamoyltransferase complex dimerization subunit type 1 TsaB [Candidatus Saganbacteria bacterium]
MKVLGISTATKIVGAGFVEDGRLLAEFTSSALKSEDIVVLIERIMTEAGADIKDIGAIAVSDGPGSYSGLRGGLAAAKSFAQVLNIPVIGVSTLEAMAYNLVNVSGTIAVVCDAVRDEVNFALFTSDSKKLRRITEDIVVSEARLKELLKEIKGEIYIIASKDFPFLQKSRINSNIRIADQARSAASGVNVALIGEQKLKEGKKDDYLKMTPKYSHTPNVREFKAQGERIK